MPYTLSTVYDSVSSFLSQTTVCAKLVFHSRALTWLCVGVLLLNVSAVVLRSALQVESISGRLQISSLGFLEEPTIELLAQHRRTIDLAANPRTLEGVNAVLFGNTGDSLAGFSVTSLDGLYAVIVPILALIFGCNLMPGHNRQLASIVSLPLTRSRFYVILLVLLTVSFLAVFFVFFVMDSLLMAIFFGTRNISVVKILHFNILGALWGLTFGCLGLFLGTFRKRSQAMLVGLATIVMLVGVFPHLYQYASETFVRRLAPNEMEALMQGKLQLPIVLQLLSVLNHLPGSVRIVAMFSLLRGNFSGPDSGIACATSVAGISFGSLLLRNYGSLAGASLLYSALGMVSFAKRKISI